MNEKINSIIKDYIDAKQTDYALLINGKWGCGKTYYVEHDLKDLCKSKELKYIYISLNGCSAFNKVTNKITYRLLIDNDTLSNIDDDLIDNLSNLWTELPKLHESISVLNKLGQIITKPIIDKFLSNTEPNKIVIIFDDLERISENINCSDILGLIYENYTKKGYKTIFISDETNINEENYKIIKEKVIRRTISYEPDRKMQLDSFIHSKCRDCNKKIMTYLDKNKEKFINYFVELQIKNLRTISFTIDSFISVFEKIDEDMQEKLGDILFKNILILTNEYKEGKITIDDLSDKKNLANLTLIYMLDGYKKYEGTEIKRTYLHDFHDKYISNPNFNDFILINEIFDFILTGYFNANKFDEEVKSLFPDEFIEGSEKTYRLLMRNWRELEEDKIKIEIDNLIKYLKNGKYHIMRLPYLYIYLKFIKDNNFLTDWHCNIEEVINDSFFILTKKLDKVPNEAEFNVELTRYDNTPNDQFYNDLIERIKKLSEQKALLTKNNEIETIFHAIKSDDMSYRDLLNKIDNLFQEIIRTKSEHYFLELTNKQILVFQNHMHNHFLRISNAGDVYYDEKSALEIIINYIKQNLESQAPNNCRKARLKELIKDMNNAVEHLEKTHRR